MREPGGTGQQILEIVVWKVGFGELCDGHGLERGRVGVAGSRGRAVRQHWRDVVCMPACPVG